MIRNFTLKNSLGATFSLMNAQQGAYFNPAGLGFDDTTEYEQVGEFFAPLTQRFGQQVITGVMVFGAKPYESYLAFTKFCQHSPLSLIYETAAGAFQIPCRLTKIEKGDTDGWTYLNCKVEFTALARMYKTVVANNTGTAGGGKAYLAKDSPDITGSIITIDNAEAGEVLNITADIEPIQDLNGYDAPWVGGAGASKIPFESVIEEGWTTTLNGITATFSKGYMKVTGTSTSSGWTNIVALTPWASPDFFYLPAGTYSVAEHLTVKGYVDGTYANFSEAGRTVTQQFNVMGFYIAVRSGETVDWNIPMMFVNGSTRPTTYAPYSNICPISGHTEVDTCVSGKNLIPFPYKDSTSTNNGITRTVNADGSVSFYGTATADSYYNFASESQAYLIKAGSYTFNVNGGGTNPLISGVIVTLSFRVGSTNKNGTTLNSTKQTSTWNVPDDGYLRSYVTITNGTNVGTASNPMVIKPMFRFASDTDATYEPYEGNTYTTALGRTVYGGTIDVVTGELTVTHGNIASYNGETLPSTWISDRDVYASGTTPTTGAQVVYELAAPQTYQLTPQQVKTILGKNNIFANSGDITITGRKTYGYKYNYTYGDFVADTVTIDSDSVTASPCRISIFGECTNPTWRHYLDGNSVATGYYNGTIPSGHKLVIDTTSSPYSIEEQDIAGNLIADRYELCDFSTERFFLLEYGHNTISVSHTDPDSIRLMVEGYIFYETV